MFIDNLHPQSVANMQKGNAVFDRAFDMAKRGRSAVMLAGLDVCAHVDKKHAAEIIRWCAKKESGKGS